MNRWGSFCVKEIPVMWYAPQRGRLRGLSYLGSNGDDETLSLQNQADQQARDISEGERELANPPEAVKAAQVVLARYGQKTSLTTQESVQKANAEKAVSAHERQVMFIKAVKIEGGKAALKDLQLKIKAAQEKRAQKIAAQQVQVEAPASAPAEVESAYAKSYREMQARTRLREAAQPQREFGGQEVPKSVQIYDTFMVTARDLGAELDQLKASGNKAAAQARVDAALKKLYDVNMDASKVKIPPSATADAVQAMDNALNFYGPTSGKSVKDILINFSRAQLTDLRNNPSNALYNFDARAPGLRAALLEVVLAED